jgi:ABC-2 type transport system ATP-binding protein
VSIIQVRGLTKHYGTVKALNGVSFSVEKGEIIGLLGPNGAGKTTTMKLITGFLQPTEGTAVLAGHDVVEDKYAVQRILGYLPENAPLYFDMAVQEYLLMMADMRQIPESDRLERLSEAVYSTGLEEHLTKPISSLSKGFRQRVGLAQAILHKPEILILDEPTNGLDPTQILEIRHLIQRLAKDSTVIVSTHILSEVEATCHRAIIIMDGEIRADADLKELTATSSAVVAINDGAPNVEERMSSLPGVSRVDRESHRDGYIRYAVTAEQGVDICPMVYDLARESSWRIAELRPATRTLESVFKELAEQRGVAA